MTHDSYAEGFDDAESSIRKCLNEELENWGTGSDQRSVLLRLKNRLQEQFGFNLDEE